MRRVYHSINPFSPPVDPISPLLPVYPSHSAVVSNVVAARAPTGVPLTFWSPVRAVLQDTVENNGGGATGCY